MSKKKNTTSTPVTTLKEPWAPKRSTLVTLLCFTLVFAILSGLFGAYLIKDYFDEKAESATFNYEKIDISDYVPGFSSAMVSGLKDIPGKDVKPTDVDADSVKKYINSVLLENATAVNGGKANKTKPVGYADQVALYILEVTLDGTLVDTEYFENAYEVGTIQVGAEIFGKDFDDKLIGLVPENTGKVTFLTVGKPVRGDVLSVSYTATIDGEDEAYESWTNLRIDTASPRNEALCDAILSGCETVGQRFTFTLTHDIDDDGEDEKVEYAVTVGAIVTEEEVAEITFVLPEDYFTENQDEEYTSLNGKTLKCRLVIDYSVDYTANTWETMTKSDMSVLGYTATEENDTQRGKCIEYVTDVLTLDHDETKEETALGLIWQKLLDEIEFDSLPEEAVAEIYESAYGSLLNNFYYNGGSAYYTDINAFGPVFFSYDATEYEKVTDYLNDYFVPRYVKQQMLVYAIYGGLVEDPKGAKLDEKYEEWVDSLTADAGEGVTEEEVIEYYGEDYIRSLAIADLANDYLLENNSINWELAPEIEE